MSIKEIRKRHEAWANTTYLGPAQDVVYQDRAELLRVIDALLGLNYYLCVFPDIGKVGAGKVGAAYRKRDVDAILRGEVGDE